MNANKIITVSETGRLQAEAGISFQALAKELVFTERKLVSVREGKVILIRVKEREGGVGWRRIGQGSISQEELCVTALNY